MGIAQNLALLLTIFSFFTLFAKEQKPLNIKKERNHESNVYYLISKKHDIQRTKKQI